MPKIKYKDIKFRDKSLDLINWVNEIVETYSDQGYNLTLRQLYYQFVARDIIPNNQKQYDNLGELVNNARLAGLVDWYAIEDRTRNVRNTFHWQDPSRLLQSAAQQFSLNKWEGQPDYVEVWVEKDALVEVIGKPAEAYDVPYFSCRGYVSQSEMWAAARRIESKLNEHERAVIIHLGDHDPSGKDMTRDIEERIRTFIANDGYYDECFSINRIALNMEQIERYNPPPNPAKLTDSRCGKYIREYGYESWELDALEPSVLDNLISETILCYLDKPLYDSMARKEEKIKDELLTYARAFRAD